MIGILLNGASIYVNLKHAKSANRVVKSSTTTEHQRSIAKVARNIHYACVAVSTIALAVCAADSLKK